MLSFVVTPEDAKLIQKIAERATRKAAEHRLAYSVLDASMDITACHVNDVPLQLRNLLEADDVTFGHDVFGIRRYLDRETGKLGNCFIPRLAVRGVDR